MKVLVGVAFVLASLVNGSIPNICSYLTLLTGQIVPQLSPGCVSGNSLRCNEQLSRVVTAFKSSFPTCKLLINSEQLGNDTSTVMDTFPEDGNNNSFTLYVSPTLGNDLLNSGLSRADPLQSIGAALNVTRQLVLGNNTIVLMAGVYRLLQPMVLDDRDSFLTLQGENGAILSGAMQLDSSLWTNDDSLGVYSLDISNIFPYVLDLGVLYVNNTPRVRARYPNVNSVFQRNYGNAQNFAFKIPPPKSALANPYYLPSLYPNLTRYDGFYFASNGPCTELFVPPSGYTCNPKALVDGNLGLEMFSEAIMDVNFRKTSGVLDGTKIGTAGYIHFLERKAWGGWTFKLQPSAAQNYLAFPNGGFQNARGLTAKMGVKNSYANVGVGGVILENLLSLLDNPGEYYLDMKAKKIFYLPLEEPTDLVNMVTEIGMGNSELIIIENGNNIRLNNLLFEKSYSTVMKAYEIPSGGDWAVHRGASVLVKDSAGIVIQDCIFRYLGSNAILFSNNIRDVQIIRNEFFALSESAILLVGDSKLTSPTPYDRRFDSDFVQNVVIRNNLIGDIGLVNVQAAGVFVSISKDVLVQDNVIFNGPRGGVVYNDLFGGNFVNVGNVVFNMVTATQDHGAFNVWDRQVWIVPPNFRTSPALVFEQNFMVTSPRVDYLTSVELYNSRQGIDLDDGTKDTIALRNVLIGGFHKIKGSNITFVDNVILSNPGNDICAIANLGNAAAPGYIYANNTCILQQTKANWCTLVNSWPQFSAEGCISSSFLQKSNFCYGYTQCLANPNSVPAACIKTMPPMQSCSYGVPPVNSLISVIVAKLPRFFLK